MNEYFDRHNLALEGEFLSEALFKSILTKSVRAERSDFKFMCFATGVYHFYRLREFHDFNMREMLHVVYFFDELPDAMFIIVADECDSPPESGVQ